MKECDWLDIFAHNLVELLRSNHMTQRELADFIGVSEATISHYIYQKRMPTVKALVNMSVAFNCSVDDLIYFGDRIR